MVLCVYLWWVVGISPHFSWDILGVELLGYKVDVDLDLEESITYFPKVVDYFVLPLAMYEEFQLLHIVLNISH